MSTSEPQERELSDGDELVAYLDGELPPEITRNVEKRLASDADYAQQLHELDQAWEALDALPRTAADDDFARTTIEMVAHKAQIDFSERVAQVSHVQRRNRLGWVAAGIAVAAAGFTFASMLLPNSDTQLIDDLPVIRQVDLLRTFNDIEFLRTLADDVPRSQLMRNEEDYERELAAIHGASAATPSERRRWVQDLSPQERQALWAQQDRFNDFTPEERRRLIDLEAAIVNDEKKDDLQETLVAYGQWLVGKGENLKLTWRDGEVPAKERVNEIEQLARDENRFRARFLTLEEKRKLRAEIRLIFADHKDDALAFVRDRSPRQEDGKNRNEREVVDRNPQEVLRHLEPGGPPAELLTVWWALNNADTDEQTRERLVAQLDTESKEFYSRLGERNLDLLRFCTDSMPSLRPSRNSAAPSPMQFFANQLSPEEQRSLLELPSSEFESAVVRLFIEQANGLDELSRLIGLSRGGRGNRGRGGGGGGDGGGQQRRGGRGGRGPEQDAGRRGDPADEGMPPPDRRGDSNSGNSRNDR